MERQRQTVPIAGINRAENDLTVQDGCCETLHNLRYDAGAWRNVETFRPVAEITDFGGFTLLYKHPATADDLYIASDESGTIHEVCVSGGRLSSTQVIMRGVSELRQTFSFGNVLVFITDGRELYYVLYGNEYVAFDMPEPPDISESKENRSRFKTDFYAAIHHDFGSVTYDYVAGDDLARMDNIAPDGGYFFTRITDKKNKTLLLPAVDGEYWLGAIAVMVAYRMMDGATVANSELMIFASDGGESEDGQYVDYVADGMPSKVPESIRYGVFIGTKYKHTTCTNNFYIQPQIVINIPEGIDTRIIESVAIYSTRIIPVYDFEQTWNGKWSLSDRGSGDDNSYMWAADFRKLFTKDVDLLQEPLYRIKEIEVRDFVKNSHKEALTYTLLKNAESQPVFEPTQSLHTQVAGCYYEYNGRLHKGNIRTRLFAGYSRFCLGETEEGITTKLICRLDIDNTSKQVCRSVPAFRPTKIRRVASYPDYRAVQFAVMVDDPGSYGGKCLLNVKLDACEGNNYAYAVGTPSGNAKYPCIKMSESPVEYEQTNDDDTYIETNRVQVSATNNLFSLPFANSYRFGVSEERIIAIATVVDELSATRFGAFPLYVFTDRGVWSLESGTGEVLYSNILPVNHDQIINPNTCTALETVFYITSRGVHNLRGRSSQLISRQIERYTGELTEYLKTAQICFQFKYGDLIVYNPEYPYAYVYSLASGFWSSRDMTGRILNNGQIIMRGAIALLGDETMSCSVDCRIVTRPLKFGTTDFKRLETAVVRIMSQDCFVHVIAEGSNDCRTWITLRDVWCRRYGRTLSAYFYVVQIPAVQTASDGQRAVVDDRCGCRVVSSLYETVAVGALHSVTKRDESHCARSEIICQNFRLCLKKCFFV